MPPELYPFPEDCAPTAWAYRTTKASYPRTGEHAEGAKMAIREGVRALAEGPNFAAFTTLGREGDPMTHVIWVDCDDDHILVNTEIHRAKFKNVQRDPRVAVTIIDGENPYNYAEVRGRVTDTITGEEARRHIDELSEKYTGGPYANPIQSERVVLKIRPERQRG